MTAYRTTFTAAVLLMTAGFASMVTASEGASERIEESHTAMQLAQSPGTMDLLYDGPVNTGGQDSDDGDSDDGTTDPPDSELTDWEDPTQLDYYRDYPKDEPRPDGMSQSVASIAASMEPGEWHRLPDAKYLGEAKWADKATWDPVRKRVSYVGHHGRPRPTKWVMWDVDDGYWYRQVGDEFHPKAGIHNRWGYRSYGKYTQMADGSNVYARFDRLWKQDPETLQWHVWAMHGCYEIISNIEYFPEMGAIVAFGATETTRTDTRLCAYDVKNGRWYDLPTPQVQGRHSLMRYNPVRGEMLLLGGDQSYRTAQILYPDGSLERVADSPRNTRIRVDQLTVDPISGHYLLMTHENDPERGVDGCKVEFFGFDAETNEWYLSDRWNVLSPYGGCEDDPEWPNGGPFGWHDRPVVTAIPEHGVTIWIDSTRPGVHLYKHDPPAD